MTENDILSKFRKNRWSKQENKWLGNKRKYFWLVRITYSLLSVGIKQGLNEIKFQFSSKSNG